MKNIRLMRYLNLLPIELLPSITPQDQDFAEKISTDFDLPLNEVMILFTNIREDLNNPSKSDTTGFMILTDNDEGNLISGSIEVIAKTDKGDVKIGCQNPIYKIIENHLKVKRNNLKKKTSKEVLRINSTKVKNDFQIFRIFAYFTDTSLIQSQRQFAIGLCLIYFRLVKWKSESEFDPSVDAETKYIDYICGRVKRIGLKYRKNLPI